MTARRREENMTREGRAGDEAKECWSKKKKDWWTRDTNYTNKEKRGLSKDLFTLEDSR